MNSLTQAVANVLNLFSPNGSDFNVYSYLDDFDYLWGLGAHVNSGLLQSCSAGMAEGNQLVIWDGTPQHRDASGGANIQDHVTVFDWLVAMSLRAAESPAAPQYRVFVLDLASSRHSCSFSCQVFPMLLPRMPWVRVIRPAGADEEKPVPVPGNASDNLVEATRLGAVLPQPDVLGVDRLIELHRMADVPTIGDDTTLLKCTATLLRQLWKSELTKAETRHSVSNLVAPFVLVDGLCEEGWLGASRLQQKLAESRLRAALGVLLRQLGVLPQKRQPKDAATRLPLVKDPDFFPQGHNDVFGRFKQVRFLLIDDQYRLGYEDILACLLFGAPDEPGEPRVLLTAKDSPKCLVDALYAAVKPTPPENENAPLGRSEEDHLRRLLNFFDRSGACEGLRDHDPSLVRAAKAARERLERLHRQPPGEATEKVISQQSPTAAGVGTCEYCGGPSEHNQSLRIDWDQPHVLGRVNRDANDPRDMAFDILVYDLRLFDANIRSERESLPEFESHLLLPLLLSHLDPSLPIVVFSSSQQRTIAQALGHRPSIITTFSKPVVSGYLERRSGEGWISDLCQSIRKALWLHEIRVVWKRLADCSDWRSDRWPAFEISMLNPKYRRDRDNESKYNLHVYNARTNYDTTAEDGRPRIDKGSQAPQQLQGKVLIGRLVDDYCRYLLGNRFFEYLTVPWELLEGVMTPRTILRDPTVSNPEFRLSPELDSPDNHMAGIFRLIRHNKAHGHAEHPGRHRWDSDRQRQRLVAILFHILIDFVARDASPDQRKWDTLFARVTWKLVTSYSHTIKGAKTTPRPNTLTCDDKISSGWPLFALFTMVAACRLAHQGAALSTGVATALEQEVNRQTEESRIGQVGSTGTQWYIRDESGKQYSLPGSQPHDVCGQALGRADNAVFGIRGGGAADRVLRWNTIFWPDRL
ncbi:MAG: hypothetical protein WCB27_04670 [Thermoguttaceae bacterium]